MAIRIIFVLVFLGASVTSGYLFYTQYFKWRTCFDERGRCFDAETGIVYSEQAGVAWLAVSLVTLAVFSLLARGLAKALR